jgi:hypothetical protein
MRLDIATREAGGGARRHPRAENSVDGKAAEHLHDVLRPVHNDVLIHDEMTTDSH